MRKIPSSLLALLAIACLAALAAPLAAENLLPGDNGCEVSEGFFRLPWGGETLTWTSKAGVDAPQGERYASLMVPADRKHVFMGALGPDATMQFRGGRDYVFSCWMRCSGAAKIQLGVVHCGWKDTCFYDLKATKEWQRLQIPFQIRRGGEQPYWLLLEITNQSGAPMEICVDGTQLEADARQAGAYQGARGLQANIAILGGEKRVFGMDEAVSGVLDSTGYASLSGAVTAQLRVTDYQGQELLDREFAEEPAQGSDTLHDHFELPGGKPGLYVVRGTWRSRESGEVLAQCQQSYVVIRDCYVQDPEVEPYLGTSGGFPAVWRKVGPKWAELSVRWEHIMPERNVSKVDGFLKRFRSLKEQGYKVKLSMVHLPATPAWARRPDEVAEAKAWGLSPSVGFFPTEEALESLSVVFEDMIRRAGTDIDLLEIGGEDELISGSEPYYRKKYPQDTVNGIVHGPVCRDIARIATVYLQAARRARPDIPVAAGRPSGIAVNFEFSRDVLTQVQGNFEYFPMDCYPYGMRYINEENKPYIGSANVDFPGVFERANRMTRTYLQGQIPFVSEFGFAIDNRLPMDHPLQQMQCAHMLSAVLTAKLLGSPFFFWFNTQNVVESKYFDYGLWHIDGNPALSIPAVTQLCHVVENVRRYDSRLGASDSNLKLGVFGQRGRATLAVWTDKESNPVKIPFPAGTTCRDFLGNEVPMPKDGRVVADVLPLYFTLTGADAFEKLQDSLRKAENQEISLSCQLDLRGAGQTFMVLQDSDTESTAAVTARVFPKGGASRPLVLQKRSGTPFPWRMRLPIARNVDGIDVILQDAKGLESKVALSFPFNALKKGQNSLAVFGKRRQDIFPSDPHIRWDGYQDLGGELSLRVTDDSLVIQATVADDRHFNTHSDFMIWDGDCLQFAVVPEVRVEQEGITQSYGGKDLDMAVALTPEGPRAWVYNGGYPAEKLRPGKDFQVTRDDAAGITTYTVTLDRKTLGLQEAGRFFRFSAVVMDDDEGGGQTYYYQYSPGITNGKRVNLLPIFRMP